MIGFAIPGIIATLFAVSLVMQPDIPFSAANPRDTIDIEYAKHQVVVIPDGDVEKITIQKTEILEVQNDGNARYYVVEDGTALPSIHGMLDENRLQRLKAVIKETGFVTFPVESFQIKEGVENYQRSSVRVELNGMATEVRWQDEAATDGFIPPLVLLIESELDCVIDDIAASPSVSGDAAHCTVSGPLSVDAESPVLVDEPPDVIDDLPSPEERIPDNSTVGDLLDL